MKIQEWAFIALAVLAVFFYQRYEISSLSDNVDKLTSTVTTQKQQISDLNTSVTGIVQNDVNQSNNRVARDTNDAKVRKDTSNEAIFAKKPGLLEYQINQSFNKFAKSFEDLTK